MGSCPKCGAGEYCRDAGNCAVIYDCDSTLTRQGFRYESIDCLRRQVSQLTARAEKAEALARRAQCFIAEVCADFGRGCKGCTERHCPNYSVDVEP